MPKRLVLASASPRRRELLALLGLPFEVQPSVVEEAVPSDVSPHVLAETLARDKARDVLRTVLNASGEEDVLVLGADTIVVTDRPGAPTVLGKPQDAEDARRMLCWLSGTTHSVCTGVALGRSERNSEGECVRSEVVTTRVAFHELTPAMIDAYVATGEPFDKAGAYGIQEGAAPFIEAVYGDYFNVVGLPLEVVRKILLPHFPKIRPAPPPPVGLPFPVYPESVR